MEFETEIIESKKTQEDIQKILDNRIRMGVADLLHL